MRETVLRSCKGRRPGLSQNFQKDNLLLYQLHLLRLEGNNSYKDIQNWFYKLFPDSVLPTAAIYHSLSINPSEQSASSADQPRPPVLGSSQPVSSPSNQQPGFFHVSNSSPVHGEMIIS
ncbi:hypothetical protein RRG08_009089 [Elysia crispata]|uniref:Uncharacterized protein n=1 Tax=Elysia crispata TaxID=231223 RepID=A0AAE0Y828_9GAST|nr:hypothetical protein RRG08_009089 [Elysia crispata]